MRRSRSSLNVDEGYSQIRCNVAAGGQADGRSPGEERPMMTQSTSEYTYVTYENLDGGRIARIMLNRPDSRNAQHRGLLVDLHDAFLRAEADDEVRVVILGGVGPIFSSGHDMGSAEMVAEPPQDHNRAGPGHRVRRRSHADVGVRPNRGR
jgi:hypothetical protein